MAYATETTTFDSPSFADRLTTLRGRITDALAKRAMYRRTLNELSALSNRELSDLGLHRSGIRRVAIEAAYGK